MIKAGTEGVGVCAKEKGAYEGSCAKSWVSLGLFCLIYIELFRYGVGRFDRRKDGRNFCLLICQDVEADGIVRWIGRVF